MLARVRMALNRGQQIRTNQANHLPFTERAYGELRATVATEAARGYAVMSAHGMRCGEIFRAPIAPSFARLRACH